ncbi:hypothetical protein BMS3Abin08_02108 [bacterium BMS3Abin08]|nr:hypothetical protein BMS3Abin08_02108 [bacterium BMS3Abin08]
MIVVTSLSYFSLSCLVSEYKVEQLLFFRHSPKAFGESFKAQSGRFSVIPACPESFFIKENDTAKRQLKFNLMYFANFIKSQ